MKDALTNGTDVVVAVSGNRYVPRARERFTYDEDGNMTRDGRWAMTWDGENRLVSMETTPAAVTVGAPRQRLEFGYDSQSRRVHKKVSLWNTTSEVWEATSDLTFVWDGWNCVAEVSQAGGTNAVSSFLWGLDLSGTFQGAGGVGGLLAITQDGATSLPYYDGNGNVMGLVDATSGVTVAIYEYGPFGETIRSTGLRASKFNWKFSTKYTDQESGWGYYKYRYYLPCSGRWLSRDPIGEEGGENLYVFVLNAPVDLVDPFGMSADDDYLPPGTGVVIGGKIHGFDFLAGFESLILHKDFVKRLLVCECVAWKIERPKAMAGAKRKSGLVLRGQLREIERFTLLALNNAIDNRGPYPIEGTAGCKDGKTCKKNTLLATGNSVLVGITDLPAHFMWGIPSGIEELTFGVSIPFGLWDGKCQ